MRVVDAAPPLTAVSEGMVSTRESNELLFESLGPRRASRSLPQGAMTDQQGSNRFGLVREFTDCFPKLPVPERISTSSLLQVGNPQPAQES